MLYYTILYHIILYYTRLDYTTLHYTIIYYTIIYYTSNIPKWVSVFPPPRFIQSATACVTDMSSQVFQSTMVIHMVIQAYVVAESSSV